MPKTKKVEEVKEEKVLDPDLILGDELIPGTIEDEDVEEESEDGTILDDEEVDPFKDKWEE